MTMRNFDTLQVGDICYLVCFETKDLVKKVEYVGKNQFKSETSVWEFSNSDVKINSILVTEDSTPYIRFSKRCGTVFFDKRSACEVVLTCLRKNQEKHMKVLSDLKNRIKENTEQIKKVTEIALTNN